VIRLMWDETEFHIDGAAINYARQMHTANK